MMQDFKSVSDHFGTLCIKGLKVPPFLKSTLNLRKYEKITKTKQENVLFLETSNKTWS